jgi:ubiquinol-cytochrome c reductase cytochrome c subunit
MMKHIIPALAGFALSVAMAAAQEPSAPPSAPAGNADYGKTLFQQVGCYECHGLAGQGAQSTGPRLSRTALPFAGFLSQLRHPQSQMPPYEVAVLSDQDAADIYAYVRQMPVPRDPKGIPLLESGR